jgi:two-component system NtrC family sensor kinase
VLSAAVVSLGVALAAAGAGAAAWRRDRRLALSATAEHALAVTLERRIGERTAELADAERVLRRMWTLGHQVALELEPARVLQRFIEAVVDVAQADGGALALAHDEWTLRVAAAAGSGAALEGATIPIDHSVMGRVLRTGEVWRVTDALADDVGGADVASAGLDEEGVPRGVVCVPLVRRADPGVRHGALTLYSRVERRFTDAEVARIRAMTDMLSVALANAELVESLRRQEWRYRTLFRAAPDVVLVVLADGEVREANDCARDLTGLEPAALVGRPLASLVLPEDRPLVAEALARALADGAGEAGRVEVRVLAEGTVAAERVASLAVRRVPAADPPAALVIARDITAEREMRARLLETERLAAVGELVAGVAHEVNNPLGSISAYAQLLLREGGLTADQQEMVEVVQGEAVRASHVVRDLLAFARRTEPAREPVDVTALVERTLRLRGYQAAAARVVVRLELDPALPPVTGDPRQLQQVLLNLVTNAIQAMAGDARGGERVLTVRTRLRTPADPPAQVELELSDTGPGVAPDARARIFEPFFSTKGEGAGTGLGLSVSYGIVSAHGGTIELVPGGTGGATFRVSLPAAAADGRDPLLPPHPTPDRASDALGVRFPLAGLRLLFVDGESALRSAAEAFADARGFTVLGAADGLEALSVVRATWVDAVVCDVRTPLMGGAEFHAVLHREKPALASRTVFTSGDPTAAPAHLTVIAKPFRFEDLERAVMRVMG